MVEENEKAKGDEGRKIHAENENRGGQGMANDEETRSELEVMQVQGESARGGGQFRRTEDAEGKKGRKERRHAGNNEGSEGRLRCALST